MRINNEFPDLPVFRAAATLAHARVHQVVAVALRLDCLANAASPRGTVADMSVPEFAAALQLPANTVARIRAALEDPDIGWLAQDLIVDFYERNPDDCDPTAAERQRRHRAKLRADRRELAAYAAANPSTGPPLMHSHGASRRDSVTVTPRYVTLQNLSSLPSEAPRARASGAADRLAEKKEERTGASGEVVHRNSGPSGDNLYAIDPELWLATEGQRIVIERMAVPPSRAAQLLERWRIAAGDSHAALAAIIAGADATDYVGAQFHNLVVLGCKRAAATQPQLPLPPMSVGQAKKADAR